MRWYALATSTNGVRIVERIYLTGVPASGKSTFCERLRTQVPKVETFSYSEVLLRQIQKRSTLTHSDISSGNLNLVSHEDISNADNELATAIERAKGPVIVDSHAVNGNNGRWRISPFKRPILARCGFTRIILLKIPHEEYLARVSSFTRGRPTMNEYEFTQMDRYQEAVAVSMSVTLGASCYIYHLDGDVQSVVAEWVERLS